MLLFRPYFHRYFKASCTRRSLSGANYTKGNDEKRVLFFGNDLFSVITLSSLLSEQKSQLGNNERFSLKNVEVVSDVSLVHRKGRKIFSKSPLLNFAESEGLICHLWQDVVDNKIPVNVFSHGIVASFGRMIPSNVINGFQCGMLNVHPSLLPRWQGAAPIVHTILNGDQYTGISIIDVSPNRFDKGLVYYQIKIEVPPHSTATSLTTTLANLGGISLHHVLSNFEDLHLKRTKQDKDNSTNAYKINPEQGQIKWNLMTSQTINCMKKAFEDKIPIFTFYNNSKVKLLDISVDGNDITTQFDLRPGQGFYCTKKQSLVVKCFDGWLNVHSLCLLGKKSITSKDFHNGYIKTSGHKSSQCFEFQSNPT